MTDRYRGAVKVTWKCPDYGTSGALYPWDLDDQIQITEASCRALGVSPPRYGRTWAGLLGVYRRDASDWIQGVPLGITGGSAATMGIVLYNDLTGALVTTITVTPDAAAPVTGIWPATATFTIGSTIAAGRYAAELRMAWPAGAAWTVCKGRIDILPAYPVAS